MAERSYRKAVQNAQTTNTTTTCSTI